MSRKGQGKRLSESQRSDIIAKLSRSNPPSKRSVAREFDVTEGAIRKIWENREEIQNRCASMSEDFKAQTFRVCVGRFSELENLLYLWIDSMRRANMPVPPSLAILKAKQIASDLSISEDDFKASWQWFDRFRARRGLKKVLLHGEGAQVDKDDPELLNELNDLYALIKQYDPENVYNMDETGLFYRLLPRYTLLMPHEDVNSTRGKKKAKERISLIVCANATGTHKVSCTVIGKYKEPACIKNREWPLKYLNQNKAWMDVETCWKWFNEVFFPEVRKRTGRRVLLLMDNAPGHFEAFERDNVKVAFLPPNCTSWKQPCDMGIIAALKKRYKYLYLKDVLEFYELDDNSKIHKKEQSKRLRRGAAGVAYGNPAHLLDAAHYVKHAWDAISAESIKNSFRKAELQLNLEGHGIEETDMMAPEILRHFETLNISMNKDELEQFVHVDDERSEEFAQAILEDVEDVLTNSPVEDMPIHGDNDDECAQSIATISSVDFDGFDQLYNTVLKVEDQLLCTAVQVEAGDTYDDLRNSFEVFQKKLRRVTLQAKRRKIKTWLSSPCMIHVCSTNCHKQ